MLDKFPIELVEHIVRLAAFPSSLNLSPSTYRERQDTLLSLCHTNKKLCSIAQPVLLELVKLDTEKALDSFLEAVKLAALGRLVKRLRISEDEPDTAGYYVPTKQRTRWLGEHLPNVVEYFHEVSEEEQYNASVDLSDMQSFPNLQSLVLHHVVLLTSEPFTLPSLQHIQRLVVLSYAHTKAAQLSELANSLGSASNLFTVAFGDLLVRNLQLLTLLSEPRQLRLVWDTTAPREYDTDWPLDDRSADRVAKALLKLDDLLTDDKLPHLRTLYLPILLDASVTPMRLRLQYAVRDLDESCKSRKVDVVFEQPGHLERDSLVPHAFWRRREREIEAEKQREGLA
ncbi:hypothetical protein JCM8547_007070 [Rhodosporidiobolus lusitaniae]